MWFAAGSQSDHNTIRNFRFRKLKGHFKKIFNQVVALLADQGFLSLKDIYLDGTKIEANGNRYPCCLGKGHKHLS